MHIVGWKTCPSQSVCWQWRRVVVIGLARAMAALWKATVLAASPCPMPKYLWFHVYEFLFLHTLQLPDNVGGTFCECMLGEASQ